MLETRSHAACRLALLLAMATFVACSETPVRSLEALHWRHRRRQDRSGHRLADQGLTECLENHEDLAKRPEYYFPWVYRARLETRDEPMQTGPPSAASSPSP